MLSTVIEAGVYHTGHDPGAGFAKKPSRQFIT